MVQPYTKYDLARGEAVVRALHGLDGFDTWAEHIAKEIAAERERAAVKLEKHMPDDRSAVMLRNAAAIVRASDSSLPQEKT